MLHIDKIKSRKNAHFVKKLVLWILAVMAIAPLSAQHNRTVAAEDTSVKVAKAEVKKDTMTVARVWRWSLIAPSFGQFYNRQYWKVPVVLGGMGAMLYGAYAYKSNRGKYVAGAGVVYWASLLDGTLCYRFHREIHSPSKAAIYSAMLPGLGQAYNRKYWKLPLVYGGFLGMGYLIQSRHFRYKLFGDAYSIAYALDEVNKELNKLPQDSPERTELQQKADGLKNSLGTQLSGFSMERLKTYKDAYRRDRDYYIILTCLFYGLNVIDAVVDAHFFTYDMSNDLSFQWSPFTERMANAGFVTGISLNFNF